MEIRSAVFKLLQMDGQTDKHGEDNGIISIKRELIQPKKIYFNYELLIIVSSWM
jgi:hypothetical protein